MKDPAFLFYPGDWLGGTMGMTCEQKGAYLELLIFQFNNGKFTEIQAKHVLSICFAQVWDMLRGKFQTDGKLYWNERLNHEIDKRKRYSESRRNNALSKDYKKKKKLQSISKAYAKHMENENEDENRNRNRTENELIYPFDSQNFMQAWNVLIKEKKWRNKSHNALQAALKKLSKHSEQDAIEMINNTIAGEWQGFFELKNKQNGKQTNVRNSDGSVNWSEVNKSADEFLRKQGLS